MSLAEPTILRMSYDVPTAAKAICVTERTMYRLIKAGHIKTYMPRGRERGKQITHAELERYIAESAGTSEAVAS